MGDQEENDFFYTFCSKMWMRPSDGRCLKMIGAILQSMRLAVGLAET